MSRSAPDLLLKPLCVVCGISLSGWLSSLFRIFGIRRSHRNPNVCNRCNTHAEEGRIIELTVLFADLTSFTELTNDLGPERIHAIVDAFLQMATRALVRHDAFIDKYIGDAVMAFFNAPIRRPDHAARAVAAAREIQDGMAEIGRQFGLELQVRCGIASGWARVGRVGSTDSKDYTAIGEVVNLAARLETKARVQEIVIDQNVYQAVAGQYPDLTPESLTLKGFREPVNAYRLGGVGSGPAPAPADEPDRRLERGLGLGTTIFAILGAPCAAATLIGPLAVAAGITGVFGAGGILWLFESLWVRRIAFTLVTLLALANLYTLWHAWQLRRQAIARGEIFPMTRLERRRTFIVAISSVLILLIVAADLWVKSQMMGGFTF